MNCSCLIPGILAGTILVALILVYWGRAYWAWVSLGAAALYLLWRTQGATTLFFVLAGLFAAFVLLLGLKPLRRNVLGRILFPIFGKILPKMGETERIALDAGTVWWDAELFSGDPNWRKLLDFSCRDLSAKEKAFLDGPVKQLCARLNDWDIIQRRDLQPEIWAEIKKNKFLGMIIPEEFGGLGFSAYAHAQVITMLSSRSVTAAVTVMVPNSLGPAELLMHYGTDEQKTHWLPRLADGEEIPCFALTGPEAGSDASAMQSTGVVCRGLYEGKEVLGMRLNWRKRYITLGPVSTVLGLAFQLKDPERLLGEVEEIGITCALIPSHLPGIDIGKRHDPLGVPFQNGPNWGHDVFVPLTFIIGGPKMAGQGWRMLMESLGAGRGISLPSLAVGGAQLATRVVGAYATVREQFDTPIGRFEGIEEPLARIGGLTFLMSATRRITLGAIDAGEKPAVLTAIAKAYLTDLMRQTANDAMDIRAGAGIMQGPRNLLGQLYKALPIGITVEGANILTRSMIVYGQGAIRCHPYVQKEMRAVADGDLAAFDAAFFKHINFVFKNMLRAFWLGLTGARLAAAPSGGGLGIFYRRLSRMSAAFALFSDVAMGTLGGNLKRREKISGRLADCLAWLYMASATLKEYHDQGASPLDRPFAEWGCRHALFQIQEALRALIDNLPLRPAAWLMRLIIFPWGPRFRPPGDRLGSELARNILEDREERLRLTRDIYVPPGGEIGLGRLEAALDKHVAVLSIEKKIRDAVRAGKLDKAPGDILACNAEASGVITPEEHRRLRESEELQDEVIQVDAFAPGEFLGLRS